MSLFDVLVGAAVGIGGALILGSSVVTGAVIGALAAKIITDDELWEKINSYLCDVRDKILDWLDKCEYFDTKYIKFLVTNIDAARSGIRRILKVYAINEADVSVEICERILTQEELEELGISVDEEQIV